MAPAALETRRGVKWMFSGPQGLRAGWGLATFALLTSVISLALLVVTVVSVIELRARGLPAPRLSADLAALQSLTPALILVFEGPVLAALVLATVIMARIERRPLATYGFGLDGLGARFFQGLLCGIALLSILIGALWLTGAIRFGAAAPATGATVLWGLKWAGCFLLVAAVEEIAMRGYVLSTLARGLNFRWAAVISSGVFMLLHLPNGGESVMGLIQVFLIGIAFSFSVWRTGTIWWALGYHAAWDWAQSFLFGVADSGLVTPGALMSARGTGPAWLSGGATGPEGSALMFAIFAASLGVISLMKPSRK
jgi:hypothetical protein